MIKCDPQTEEFLKQLAFFATHNGARRFRMDPTFQYLEDVKVQWDWILRDEFAYQPDRDIQELVTAMRFWIVHSKKRGNQRYAGDDGLPLPQFKTWILETLQRIYRDDPHVSMVFHKRSRKRVLQSRSE